MATTGDYTKLRVIISGLWKYVLEALAWSVVAAFVMLLLQARQVDRWDIPGKLGILVVVLLFGAAMTYLRAVLFSQSRTFKSVEAESFVLKEDGTVLARLARDGGPGGSLTLYDVSHVPIASLGATDMPLESSLVLRDADGRQRLRLLVDSGGGASVEVFEAGGTQRAVLCLNEHNLARLTLSNGTDIRESLQLASSTLGSHISILTKDNRTLAFGDDLEGKGTIRVFTEEGPLWTAP